MVPNKSTKTAKSKQRPQEEQQEEILQAVVLADSFEKRFVPFTIERPRCLLPLANTPLIEYTLDFLANAGVQDVFVSCKNHADQVEDYINSSKWKLKTSPFRKLIVLKSVADNLGTVMRDLDASDLISSDFLLISGDVISNMDLEPGLAKHRARREKKKDAIMTMILKEVGPEQRIKSKGSRPVFVIDPISDRCLFYEEMGQRRNGARPVTLDPELLSENSEISIRDDLIDCRIDICTQEVLAAWSDNFDFTSLRKGFLRGVLKDFETYGKTIHTHVVADSYAARVKSLRAYDAITKDIRERWTYPLCPDSNLVPGQSYRFVGGSNYQDSHVALARTAVVTKSILGRGTVVGDGSRITGSTVGRRCKIGKNVVIDRAYIWDDAIIEDNSIIRQAIVADDTHIASGCNVKPGALVSYKVHTSNNSVIPQGSTTRANQIDDYIRAQVDDYSRAAEDDDESDASSKTSARLFHENPSIASSASSISTLASYDEDIEPVEDRSRRSSFRSDPSDETGESRDFYLEATASLLDGFQKDDLSDTIQLELNSYRMSTNASQHEVRRALVTALMNRISNLVNGDALRTPLGAGEAVKSLFANYKTLIEKTMFDQDAGQKIDQVDFLLLVQKDVVGRPKGDQLLLFVAHHASELDILEADGVLQWWEDERSKAGDMETIRALTKPLVDALQEEEDDESEDEEDSEDEDEDEDDDED